MLEENFKPESNLWLPQAFISSLMFMATNAAKAELATTSVYQSILYIAPGAALGSLAYQLYHASLHSRETGVFWNNQNVVIGSKVNNRNLKYFIANLLSLVYVVLFVNLTIYLAQKAKVNLGLVLSLWGLSPIMISVADKVIFGAQLKTHQVVGTALVVASIPLIPLSTIEKSDTSEAGSIHVAIPICTSLATILGFTAMQIVSKKMKRLGFDIVNATFCSLLILNSLLCIGSVWLWQTEGLTRRNLAVGVVGGLFEIVAKVLAQQATATGYSGPAASIISMSGVELTLFVALKEGRSLSTIEMLAAGLSTVGSVAIVNPFAKSDPDRPQDSDQFVAIE